LSKTKEKFQNKMATNRHTRKKKIKFIINVKNGDGYKGIKLEVTLEVGVPPWEKVAPKVNTINSSKQR
jgi:hypothetical protein